MKSTNAFSPDPESVAAARRFTSDALSDLDPETLEVAVLMVSELATNCIRHTRTGFELVILRTPEEVRIEVTDQAGGTPRMKSPAVTDPTGRGLQIVDLLSQAWGVERSAAPGKTVWFIVTAGRTAAAEVQVAEPAAEVPVAEPAAEVQVAEPRLQSYAARRGVRSRSPLPYTTSIWLRITCLGPDSTTPATRAAWPRRVARATTCSPAPGAQ